MEKFLFGFIQGFMGYILYIGSTDILQLNTQGGDNVIILIIMCFYICTMLLLVKEIFIN